MARSPRISIHVPLAGDDGFPVQAAHLRPNFYPRPPCGGRLFVFKWLFAALKFLSTSPLRGTTAGPDPARAASAISIHVPLAGDDRTEELKSLKTSISIHVPLAGDDCWFAARQTSPQNFYPRPPCGGRPAASFAAATFTAFLSTSPLRGTTEEICDWFRVTDISIHVPLAGDDSRALR